jgi:hypothetical protein
MRISVACLRVSIIAAFATILLAYPAQASTVSPASMGFDPASYEFGPRVPATGASAPKAFTLTNTGEFALTITYVSLVWGPQEYGDPEIFRMTSDKCIGTLAVGASCTIEVAFDPQLPGSKWGTLTVAAPFGEHCNSKGECKANNVNAQAQMFGIARTIAVTPSVLSFLPFPIGSGPSPAKTVTFTNEGESGVTIHNVLLTNHEHFNADQFRLLGGTCTEKIVSLPPSGSCTAQVAFAPTRLGPLSGDLSILDSAVGGQQFAALEGEGVPLATGVLLAELRAFISGHPARKTRRRAAVFRFSGTDAGVQFECRLDSSPFAPCSSPLRVGHLGLGHHYFAVKASQGSGRLSSPASYRWRVEPRR